MSGLSPIGVTIIPKSTGSIPKPASQAGKNKVTMSVKEKGHSMFSCMIMQDINFLSFRDCVVLNLVSSKSRELIKDVASKIKKKHEGDLIDFDKLFNQRDPKNPKVNVFYSQGRRANILSQQRDGFIFNSGNVKSENMSIQGLQIWSTLHKERARLELILNRTEGLESESKEVNESFECAFCVDKIALKEFKGLKSFDIHRITHKKCEDSRFWSTKDAITFWGFTEFQLFSLLSITSKLSAKSKGGYEKFIIQYTAEDLYSLWSLQNIAKMDVPRKRISDRQRKYYHLLPKEIKSYVTISDNGLFVLYNRAKAKAILDLHNIEEDIEFIEKCKKRKIGEEEFEPESYSTPPSGPSKATVEVPPFDLDSDES